MLNDITIQGPIVDITLLHTIDEPYRFEYYAIVNHQTQEHVGVCDIRVAHNEDLFYAGNIGYEVYEAYQGHGYAYEAVKLLFKRLRQLNLLKYVYITCSIDNLPSYHTCLKLNGNYCGLYNVPKTHVLYQKGECQKHIFRYEL